MTSINKRVVMVAVIIALFSVATVPMSPAYSAELTASDKATEFLSSVVGLDLTKYTLISPTPPPGYDTFSYPPELGGLVKEECPGFKFKADGSTIDIMSIFYNGQMKTIKINNLGGDYIYSEPPARGILDQAKNILQRYQAYVTQVYAADSSYLVPMQNILNSVDDLSPANFTVGNVTFQVSKDGDNTRVQWIYTENDVIMDYKRVELKFCNNAFLSFRDIWRLYSVGGFSVINSEEAYKLALDTAQNCEFCIVNENVNEVVTLPDLSDSVYQMYFTMVPYRNQIFQTTSKTSRDPLTLYPYWQFYFYFKGGEIGGYSGIQVGIWGDTKEIDYCSGFGFYGASGPTGDEDITTLLPEDQTSEEQQQEQTNVLDPSVLAVAIIIAVILVMSISAIVLRRRNQRKC
jgi:hypothetical protein